MPTLPFCQKYTPEGNPLPYQEKMIIGTDVNGTNIVSTQNVPLAQRHDANTTIAIADGDFAQLQLDNTGRLKVDIGSNVTNNLSKIDRIKGTNNYNRAFTYYTTTENPTVIVHTGTTALGAETITETITYISAGTGDFRISNILYS